MKSLKIVMIVLCLAGSFAACKKDSVNVFSIEGKWEGKLGTAPASPNSFFGLNIKPGGVLERLSSSGNVSATGTWQLTGIQFTGTYTFSSGTVVNITGSVDKAQNKLSGTWQNNGNENGEWFASKGNF
jgi:hypothetical protein